ncbi:MAG: pentapeptide repeat-containing protein [Candidatus Arsenophonus phytopathogenicus]
MNINNMLNICDMACTTGSAMRDATSPRNILQYIINFFTFGGVRRNNEKLYTDLIDSMVSALQKWDTDELEENIKRLMAPELKLDNILGCSVSFTPIERNVVKVKVCKGNDSISTKIPLGTYVDVCRTLKLRDELKIYQNPLILTEQGKMNLRGVDLSNTDLTDKNLSNADLSNANLSNADLSQSNLFRANLQYTDLSNARLSQSIMIRANLRDADLRGADLSNVDLSSAELSDADLTCSNLSGANLYDADLFRTNLTCSNMTSINMSNVDLSLAKMPGANQTNVHWPVKYIRYG